MAVVEPKLETTLSGAGLILDIENTTHRKAGDLCMFNMCGIRLMQYASQTRMDKKSLVAAPVAVRPATKSFRDRENREGFSKLAS